ncbi:MAG: DNA repair exonuclease [Hespellia sp.]|nr:DNA repair exonuclease [Hespellia sp.]
MKFIHIADTHLGAMPDAGKAFTEQRPKELWDTFGKVIDLCEEEGTDLLLIAGDMFHRQPLLRELKEVNYLFSKLSHTQVVFIVGNHDYLKKDSYYRRFDWSKNVHTILSTEMDSVVFEDMELAVYGFSYDKREILEARYDEADAPFRYKYEILLAHGGDLRHIPYSRNKIVSLGYNYVAFGHIHKPHIIDERKESTGRGNPAGGVAAFAGALEPLDKNDVGEHGFIRGEIDEEGTRIEFVPFSKRQYIHGAVRINQEMTNGFIRDNLKDKLAKRGVDNLYKLTFRGMRKPDFYLNMEDLNPYGNILEIVDETKPAYDFGKLMEQNEDNLLGKFIAQFIDSEEDSVERMALFEGVQALMKE